MITTSYPPLPHGFDSVENDSGAINSAAIDSAAAGTGGCQLRSMRSRPRWFVGLTVCIVCGLLAVPVWGQENPFGGAAADDDNPFGGGALFGEAAADPLTDSGADPAAAEAALAPEETDILVISVRDSTPTTAAELLRAVDLMVKINRPDEANKYLPPLAKLEQTDQQWANLHQRYGSALLLKLQADKAYAPYGGIVAATIYDATTRWRENEDRINQLIAQLKDTSRGTRYAALVDLRRAGNAAVPLLVAGLFDGTRTAEHAGMRAALVQLGPSMIDPMLAALDARDAKLSGHAIDVLGRIGSPQTARYLYGAMFLPGASPDQQRATAGVIARLQGRALSRSEAASALGERATLYLRGMHVYEPDHENMVSMWQWDAERKSVVLRRLRSDDASLVHAARLARALPLLVPGNDAYDRLATIIALKVAKLQGGLDQPLARTNKPLFDELAARPPADMEAIMLEAVEMKQVAAATAAAEVLGESGDAGLLAASSGAFAPVVRMLRHPDRRLRMEALRSIIGWDPERGFSGASYVSEQLGYFVSSAGLPAALVVHPRETTAQTIAVQLGQLGYQADAASRSLAAVRMAVTSPDYELILVSGDMPDVYSPELIQRFRRDPHTAGTPIGIMASLRNLPAAERLAQSDPLTMAFAEPTTVEAYAPLVQQVASLADRARVPYDRRLADARQCLGWLARFAAEPKRYGMFPLAGHEHRLKLALQMPGLAGPASEVLGAIGSRAAQLTLLGYASQNTLPIDDRRHAATAFRSAVDSAGLNLSGGEIAQQYDRYNASALLDRETQQLLGSLLDSIETRLKQAP